MGQPAGQIRASFDARIARNADERMTQVKAHVDRQRATLATLEPGSPDARWVGQVVAAMERTLRHVRGMAQDVTGSGNN